MRPKPKKNFRIIFLLKYLNLPLIGHSLLPSFYLLNNDRVNDEAAFLYKISKKKEITSDQTAREPRIDFFLICYIHHFFCGAFLNDKCHFWRRLFH